MYWTGSCLARRSSHCSYVDCCSAVSSASGWVSRKARSWPVAPMSSNSASRLPVGMEARRAEAWLRAVVKVMFENHRMRRIVISQPTRDKTARIMGHPDVIRELQNVSRQVLILDDGCDHLAHVFGVDDGDLFLACRGLALGDGQRDGGSEVGGSGNLQAAFFILGPGLGQVGSEEADLVQHALHDCVQAAGSDVLRGFVDAEGELRHFLQCLGSELKLESFSVQQSGVLAGERRLGLGEDADEILDGEGLQFHADWEAALQFRNQVAGL